eukprot:COSAG01_NODE_4791_length_4740_cov_9.356820_8_plen_223_part_00
MAEFRHNIRRADTVAGSRSVGPWASPKRWAGTIRDERDSQQTYDRGFVLPWQQSHARCRSGDGAVAVAVAGAQAHSAIILPSTVIAGAQRAEPLRVSVSAAQSAGRGELQRLALPVLGATAPSSASSASSPPPSSTSTRYYDPDLGFSQRTHHRGRSRPGGLGTAAPGVFRAEYNTQLVRNARLYARPAGRTRASCHCAPQELHCDTHACCAGGEQNAAAAV